MKRYVLIEKESRRELLNLPYETADQKKEAEGQSNEIFKVVKVTLVGSIIDDSSEGVSSGNRRH